MRPTRARPRSVVVVSLSVVLVVLHVLGILLVLFFVLIRSAFCDLSLAIEDNMPA